MITTTTTYHPKVCKVALLIDQGEYSKISRWDVIGRVPQIEKALKELNIYRPAMSELLYDLHMEAKGSL